MGAGCRPDGTCDFATVFDGIACDDGIACSEGDFCWNGQCTAKSSSCAPAAEAWPMAAHDAQRTRATALLGPATPATKWAGPVPGVSAFVIAGDGTIYAADGQKVQSINPDGVATPLATVPALDLALRQDGGLYATTYGLSNGLRALRADGLAQWTFESTSLSVPEIGPSGALYAMARPDLIAIGPDGAPLWKVRTGGAVVAPAVGPDGTIYALCPDLWAVAPDGRVKWKRSIGVAGNLVVGPGGTTYVMLDGGVRAIRADGADVWEWSLGSSATFTPALSAGGDLILTAGPAIYRLDASTGTPRSTVSPPAPAQTYQQLTAPVVDGNDVLYVIANATDSNSFQPETQVTVFAIDRTDQILWSAQLTRGVSAAGGLLAIGPGRTLYVTLNNTLQVIGP
jgi:outer membrane protein assembly factor BamB